MDQEQLYQTIFKRKSVRKYQPGALDAQTMGKVEANLATLRPLFSDIRTELRVLGRDQIKGMFKSGAPHFLAIYSEGKGEFEANAGFILQQMDLFLSSQGLGTCYQGIAKASKEMSQINGLSYVIMLAFGIPAEPVHRNSVIEFKREPLENIRDAQGADELLEPARLAPSAVNHQRWSFTGDRSMINVYTAKGGMLGKGFDRIDAGIAMCHIWLAAEHLGKRAEATKDLQAEKNTPSSRSYIASLKIA